MALVTDKVNMRSFENNLVDVMAISGSWVTGNQTIQMYGNVKIEFFANYVLIDNTTLIPSSKILRITFSYVEDNK